MKRLYKIIRVVLIVMLSLLFTVPASIYVLLSVPAVQRVICQRSEVELSKLLGTEVNIRAIAMSPFNRATLLDVSIAGAAGDTAIQIQRFGVGINLRQLLHHRLVFNYAEIIGLDAKLYRDSIGAPLNIQPIIDALSPKDKSKPPTKFQFAVNTIVLRTSSVSYDILSAPHTPGRFDPSHISVTNLRADLRLPRMANDDFTVDLRRLALSEKSGLRLDNLSGLAHITPRQISVSDLLIELPSSRLSISDQTFDPTMLKGDAKKLAGFPLDIVINDNSHIASADLVPFIPALQGLDIKMDIAAAVTGSVGDIQVNSLHLNLPDMLECDTEGFISGLTGPQSDIQYSFPTITLTADGQSLADIISRLHPIPAIPATMLANMGMTTLTASFEGSPRKARLNADFKGQPGSIVANLDFTTAANRISTIKGSVATDVFDCSRLFASTGHALEQFGPASLKSQFDIADIATSPQGSIDMIVDEITYRSHTYRDITANAEIHGNDYTGYIDIDNPELTLNLEVDAHVEKGNNHLVFDIDGSRIDLNALNIYSKTGGRRLSLFGSGDIEGPDIDHINGYLSLNNIAFVDNLDNGLKIKNFDIYASSADDNSSITLSSDIVDGKISGSYRLSKIPGLCRSIVERVFPNLIGVTSNDDLLGDQSPNELRCDLTIKDLTPLQSLVNIPVSLLQPATLNGSVSREHRSINLTFNAPYLLKGKSIIEGTNLRLGLDAGGDDIGRANLYATSMVPTKRGDMTLSVNAFGSEGQLDTQLAWHIAGKHRYNGDVSLTTRFQRNADTRDLTTKVFVNPSSMFINDTVWNIEPAAIDISGKRVAVDGFKVGRAGQHLTIDGIASESADDILQVTLKNIDLDYVFETLGIENAMFGGQATGEFFLSSAFTSNPVAYTPLLKVKSMKYNHSLMGDAEIESSWDAAKKAINIDAQIHQPNGGISYIDGRILPMADSLDFHFDADRVPIGFLKPFMSAFATDVSGFASGKARLWGTFKLIDMVGDVYGEDVSLTLGFTGVTYTTTDSIHLRPGRIDIPGVTIRDKFGNKARLQGWLTHKFFKAPSFSFNVTDAYNLLVYDIAERENERWFGTVFGNGNASVAGSPGIVKIGVDIATAPKSNFSFVLTDAMQASEYNFVTFRDRNQAKKDSILAAQSMPHLVAEMKKKLTNASKESSSSTYDMNIKVDVNDNALVTLVMDPVGGDKIVARGNGNMRMTYGSANEDLKMFGTYTLSQGNYNFTLQDIIIKDFIIEDGSRITFNGNPYAAQLDIKAAYAVNANLSDLDESFLQDKELNRTNVPVRAMLLVTGDMRQPEIHYDLNFPTLTQDIYRKVRSIVNTDDMMQRQIIYLLVLNRFYTPDYMSATKGNELVSVASSTISSQLSNILGQLSDKWSISPNFRSDRGDFSDVEVDLALSSHLLNNRLLLNGNFGYRDKALNNNSFIGDFDIEYLLNRMGTIRLKAYNRYNDQNYYVKSALTTQGVGVVFKRDFDNIFSFLRPLIKRRKAKAAADSTATSPDSTIVSRQQ